MIWQPIDTVPKETDVLVVMPSGRLTVAHTDGITWGLSVGWAYDGDDFDDEPAAPTHWMHLPERPAESDAA